MNQPTRLQGVFAPVLTPFNADHSPAPDRLVRHCRWLVDQRVGLAVFGTNSEGNSLSVSEKRRLLDTLIESGLPAERMIVAPDCGLGFLGRDLAMVKLRNLCAAARLV